MNIMRFCQVGKSNIVKRTSQRPNVKGTHVKRRVISDRFMQDWAAWMSLESVTRIEMRMLLVQQDRAQSRVIRII
jgi:hypothetical protein